MKRNNTNQPYGWTTREQSQQIVDCGVDINSADMKYFVNNDDYPSPRGNEKLDYYLPCWSLGKLMSMLPHSIKGGYWFDCDFQNKCIDMPYVMSYKFGDEFAFVVSKQTMIECAVEMIVWLATEKKITF